MTPEQAYGGALKVIKETLSGIGAIRGTPCMLENVEETDRDILLTFMWEDTDGSRHEQDVLIPKPFDEYAFIETLVGRYADNRLIYRKVIDIDEPNLIQKGVLLKVCDLPEGFNQLVKGYGIIKTYEGSYSNNDILVYSTKDSIMAKQNFTGYPQKLTIIIEYTKN